jgi:DNA polymerase-3 subunit delta
MQISWQQAMREIEGGIWNPLYLVSGEEPFQRRELLERLKAHFVRDPERDFTRYESFDAENATDSDLLAALEQLPGLFDDAEGTRLVCCSHFERLSSSMQRLEAYLRSPLSSTCFVMLASKIDRRKAWVKIVEERGAVIEVNEPYDRDWPKWQSYFARKLKKTIELTAWNRLIDSVGRSLSLVWAELEKLATYVGARDVIQLSDVENLVLGSAAADVFAFVEQVVQRRALESFSLYERLQKEGESDVKLLSLLVRQFRMIENCARLIAAGKSDPKQLAPEIGSHPFFVPKIIAQTKLHNSDSFARVYPLLAGCDYELKTGTGGLFRHFLLPYFGGNKTTAA